MYTLVFDEDKDQCLMCTCNRFPVAEDQMKNNEYTLGADVDLILIRSSLDLL